MTPESIPTIVPAPASELPETGTEVTSVDFKPRRKRGPQSKIAQLPGHQRMLINRLLDDDKSYEAIVEEMAKFGVQLNTDNISKWYTGPYQEYLAALDWQDELHQLRDHAFSFGQEEGSVRFQEGVVQIGLTQIFRAMKEDRLKDDAPNSLRLFNSLARLSREALVIRKYADQCAKEKVAELKRLDPRRKTNDVEETAVQDRSDDFFGWKSADRIKAEWESQGSSAGVSPLLPIQVIPPAVPTAPLQSKLENQNSKIEKSPISPLPPPGPAGKPEGLPDISRGSESAETPGNAPVVSAHPEGMPEISVLNLAEPAANESNPQSKFQNQNSKIAESCYDCTAPLPPLLPNGQRPSNNCQACSVRLYPPGTVFDKCPYCETLQPLSSDNQRPSPDCRRCRNVLPPPGQRFVTHCPACQTELQALTCDGTRLSDRCPECRAPVPLLEPAAAPPPEPAAS